ncbi:VCBS repeat-containing protein [Sphingobium faniae]|nr:VCBS repeat-containing protein [Sphingobium faniae]
MDFERDWNFSAADDRQQALGQDVAAALRAGASDLQPGKMPHIVPGPDGTVVLPAGTDLNRIQVAGSDLVVTLPDGTQMVIDGGAVFVPRMIVGDVEIPAANLAALLIGEEPQPAAGPPQSSGGNFVDPQGDIGDRHGLGDLLPPTELAFGQPEQQEIIPVAPDDDDQPEITIVTPDQPAGASNATAQVSEAGLGPREGEPAGSAAQSDSEKTSGSIVIAALDQPATVTINGIVVTGIGQMIETDLGVLTIRSIGNGEIGYSYTLTDNIIGPPPSEIFTIIVTDADGDQATATLTISIADDAPTAIGDVDSVTEDGPLIADGNVLTGTGGADANGTDGVADVQGADGAVVSTTGTFQGSYGVLTLQADGSYVYVLANGNAAVQNLVPGQTLTESFNYSITDGDGDISTATLTITINGAGDAVTITGLDRDPAANGAEAVVLENDLADGSSPDAAALTQGGAFAIAAPDGLSTVTVGGVTVLSNGSFVAGQVITTPQGVLTITGFTPAAQAGTSVTAGTFTYSFALTGNSLDHGAAGTDSLFQSFDVVATDRDGSNASATLDIRIVDDVPVAHDDVDRVAAGSYEPEGGNVITGAGTVSGAAGADVKGADGASVAGVAAGAGGAAQVAAGTVGTAIAGTYGTLILDADGGYSYVRATGTPGGVSDSFTYTLRDGDGDLSAATLRIDIADSPVVIISIPRAGDGASVEEAGLDHPAGSKAASDAETTTGTITYSAPDGPAIISVNGTSITGVGQTIVTDKGVLTITGLTDGGIDYSYTLTTSTTGNDVTDSFQLTITDTDDNSATDSLVITIVDDVSTATPDIDSVREDGPLTADGNVMTGSGGTDANATDGNKDVAGADGAQVTGISFGGATGAVGAPVAGSYGVLQIEADGSYRYVLNNGNGAVQGLDSTQTLKEIFTYTITDGDGDPSAATLTITIHGRDDGVTITGLGGQGAEEVVYESDLADGSSPDAAALVQTGSFTLEALDGVSTITVDGKSVFSGGGFTGATITNAYGTLQITGFTPVTGADGDVIGGELFYKYTLNDNSLLHKGANDGSLTDSFLVVVTDTDSSVANASLDIRVVDDVPMAHDDVAIQTSENTPILIDVFANDVAGADGVDLSSGVVLESGAAKGTVVYQGNGVFLYTAAPGAEGEDSFTYKIIDGDGDPSIATVTITLAGDSKPSVQVSDLTVWEAGLPNGTQASGNLETDSGVMTIATGGDALAKVEVQGKDGWVEVTAATAGSPIIVSGLAGQLTVTSDGAGHYSYSYTLTANDPNHPDHDPTDGDGISGAADPRAGDSFAVRVTDSDGDVSPADSIHVTVLDDAPTLTVGGATSVVEGATATGTWSEVIGADQPGASTVVLVGANSYAIGTPINTGVGTLTVKADGTWSFAASNNLNNNANPSLSFTVKVTDADGDVAQDTQTIGITDGAGPMAGAALDLALDDQNLADGTTPGNPDFASGLASFTAGSDALTGFAFAAGTGALGGGLTWNRVSGTLIEGWDGPVNTGTKIVSLTLSAPASIAAGASGTVTVTATLLDNYDSHPGVNLDDLVALGNIGVVASDQDGDSATVTVNLTVSDDVPTAVDDGQIASVDDNASGIVIGTLSGLLANDSFGADGQGSPSITIATGSLGGTVTINGGNLVYASHHDITAPYASVVETFTYTIKDGDGDTATATFTVQLTDSGPTLSQAAASFTVDEDGLNGGITAPAPGDVPGADVVRTGTLAGLNFGGDGPGDIVLAAMADTGLRTLSGHVVETVWNPATHMLTGQDATNGTPVFTLQITNVVTGAYQFELLAPIKHSNPASEDDKSLSIGVTVRDAEGESAHGAISITINDDSPALTVGSAAAGALAVDETSLSTDGTASFAGLFTPQYGADGVGSVGNYVLGVSASGAASGVFDTATGHQVFLFQEGGKVVGRAGANAGTAAGGPVVFQLSVDAAGVVTLDQQRAVLHSPDSGPNQPLSITTASLITLTATVTDGDGDTVSATAHIATAITFFDDVGNLGSFSNISVINGANVVGHGTFAYDPGADGHGSFAITAPPLAGITYSTVQNATGALLTATTDPDGAGGNPPVTVFTLQVNADGTSVFTLVEPQVGTMETLSLLGLKAGGPTNFVESSDGSVEFTGIGGGINSSNNGFGVGNPFVRYDQGFTVEFHTPGQSGDEAPGANPEMVSSLVLKNEKVNGSLQIKVTVYNDVTGQSEVVHTNLSITESSLTVIDPIMAEFNRVVIEGVGGSGQGVRFTSIDIHKSILPADLDLSFQIQATDRDGDPTSTSTLNVFVDAASPAPPIAIDLDGDGLEFVGLAAGVTHDYGHGQVATAWVAADDGLLAHATGSVHDINFADDAAGASSDLEGLRLAYDGNGDGVFDAKDAAFGEFGIWQDANSNGKVDAGEYVSLTDAGIQSIQLVSDGRSYGAANGDVKVLGEAVFTTVDGRTGTIGDAIFASGGRESDSGKVAAASTSTTGFNQALVAASLVAAANLQPESGDVAAAAGQADDPNAGTSDQPVLTQSMFAPLESIASDQPSNALADGVQDKTEASPTAARSSHGAGEETVHHAGLGADLEAGTAAPDVADGADQASPALHQALLAQPIDLAGFDGAAAMLPADHAPAPAHAAMVAQVVSEALGHADAPNIDALLAALPNGPHTAPVFGGGAAELLDGGHMAAIAGGAGGAFDAAMVMHEAMALAHA